MATPGRSTSHSLADSLNDETYRFDFFQAVRILEALDSTADSDGRKADRSVGYDLFPRDEIVRFRALPSHNFPPGDLHSIEAGETDEEGIRKPPSMIVNFMGLFGPKGTLPRHFTREVIDHVYRKDYVIRDFLDLFNHRAISLFYRAWEKHRFPIGYQRSKSNLARKKIDFFTYCLFSIVGQGTPELTDRLEVPDELFIGYGGHFSRNPRSSQSLQQIVSDFFSFNVEVKQFQGQWLKLSTENQSSLAISSNTQSLSGNNCLGLDTIAGSQVWNVESKFRLKVGPVSYDQFQQLMPSGDNLVRLAQIVRRFVGPTLDFDVQVVLQSEEVPLCLMPDQQESSNDEKRLDGPQLGYNTWLFSSPPSSNVEDAVFVNEGYPIAC